MKINIVNINAIKVAALEHLDHPETLAESVETFRAWRKESGCSPVAKKRTFGIVYSNPEARPVQKFRFDVCGEVDIAIAENTYGVVNKAIPGGRYAKLRHKGSHDKLRQKVNALYRTWLPNSNEMKRDSALFFEYINVMPEVSEAELMTDIYFPLKPLRS
ncbi:AraC family transcriptional regulator, partial [Ghiorsea bivora]|uniref:AraC family transcriptional regulator n=1 Tax=Ghiorsea bivora TaxID=1485545 RepID=UPI00056E4B14